MNESLIGEFINDTLFDTLDLNVLVRRIVTTISFITEANSSSIEFALVGLSIYFKFSTTVNVIDDILNLDGYLVTDARTEQLFLVKLSHWYENPFYPVDSRNQYTLVPFATVYTIVDPEKPPKESTSLTMFNKCPHVVLQRDEMSIELEMDGYYIHDYHSLVSFDDIYIHDNDVFLCLETIEDLLNSTNLAESVSTVTVVPEGIQHVPNANRAVDYLSFVCMLLSIIFSALTVVTYSLFRELRTQPGVNNMVLASLMVIWQILFMVGFNKAESTSIPVCATLGVLIHYSWLLFLVWMNTCTIHMFRVFWKNPATTASFNPLKTTLVYMTYCCIVAAIPVVVNIIISSTKDQGIGYGGSLCYLSASDYFLYIISVPLCLVVVGNIGLYIAVIIQIEKTRSKVKHRSEQKSLISVYLKLSSLTGVTWIFGIVYMFIGVEWAEYLFVLFNGTQGIFVFTSFAMNKRIFELYKGLLCKHRSTCTRVGNRLKHLSSRTVTYTVSGRREMTTSTSTS